METNNLTNRILIEIRDNIQQTNARLDQTNVRLDQTRAELSGQIAELSGQIGALSRRQTETALRLATEVREVAAGIHLLLAEVKAQ